MPNDWTLLRTFRRTECKLCCLTVPLLSCFSVFILCNGNVFTEPLLSSGLFQLVTEMCVREPLANHGLFRLSGVMSRYILYTVRWLLWSVLTPSCTCYTTGDAVRIVNPFITIPITRNYNHSQLFLTLLRVYTIIILIRSWLQSLIPLLHIYTAYKHYTLIFTALLHIKSPNWLNTPSLADFSAINYCLKLSHTSRVCLLSRPHS
jgi:hypothetical protein